VAPTQVFALTGGPAQPEFNSFTPIGTSDMVDLSSGDMSYNIPLMDVGGYPLNMAYSAGVGMDQEASWVGLGWNLSVGQINRNVRGLPDDFKGDEMTYENFIKPNITVGASFKFEIGAVGVEGIGDVIDNTPVPADSTPGIDVTVGLSASYNNYTGFTLKPSVGVTADLNKNVSIGFSAESGPDGLAISPNVSIHQSVHDKKTRTNILSANFGVSMNSRQGLTSASLSMSKKAVKDRVAADKSLNKGKSIGSSIGFAEQLFTPTKRVGMETGSFTVNAQLGTEFFGAQGAGEITAYGTVTKVKKEEKEKKVKAFGYNNTDLAKSFDVLDFNREKDGAISKNTTNLPITNYTYDIYSVQGQGVSGMYRPYRNQVGFVFDTYVQDGSFSGSLGLEAGTGNLFDLGVDIEGTGVQSHSGLWENNNYILQYLKENYGYNPKYEKIHHKNVGDLSVDRDFGMFDQTGRYSPTRVELSGARYNRNAKRQLNYKMNGAGNEYAIPVGSSVKRTQRQRRNQAIYNLSKKDVENGIGYGPMVNTVEHPQEYSFPGDAKDHHTSEVQIIRNDGARYIYGLPAYNTTKKEATFAVDVLGDCQTGLTTYSPAELDAPKTLPNDKYFNRVTTPAYVHTHLLTSVLSTDYQDVDGNGPTSNDFGSYTKFSYEKKNSNYKWRVPFQKNHATFNEGLKSDVNDDQGNYVYGEKEQFYVSQIETKTHIAVFHYFTRKDAKGVESEAGGMGVNQFSYGLKKISLYAIGEYDDLGTNSAATPIKEVHFEYSYSLCKGVPNNDLNAVLDLEVEKSNMGGKLTLKKVYFTYRRSKMGKYTGYKFNYGEYTPIEFPAGSGNYINPDEFTPGSPNLALNTTYDPTIPTKAPYTGLNPLYNIKGYDSWGNYLPNNGGCGAAEGLTAAEYFFTSQNQAIQDNRAAVWSMNKISLPSGGTISVEYESDDYAFVQDKSVLQMFKVFGAGRSNNVSDLNNQPSDVVFEGLINENGLLDRPSTYIYVEVDAEAHDTDDALEDADIARYLKGLKTGPPIYFRFLMNMTKLGGSEGNEALGKYDYVTGYIEHEEINGPLNLGESDRAHFGDSKILTYGGKKLLSIPVKLLDQEGGLFNAIPGLAVKQVNPISFASWSFGRKYLSQHVYSNQANGDSEDIEAIVADLLTPSSLDNLLEVFNGPNATLENRDIGRRFIKDKSWIRLNTLNAEKLGGGCRVKSVRMSDVWEEMNPGQGNYQTMNYGQQYEYETTNGTSSGVATYEPVGNKENPFVQPVYSTTKHLLAPDEQNFMEMPFGESFFPSPQVTYSRVSVSNLTAGTNPAALQVKKLHKTGKVVTEFYTSKDYPTIVDQTIMKAYGDKNPVLNSLLKLYVREHMTASQGYVIHLNDMNGKQKAQRVYAEGQTAAISGVDYLYDNYETPSAYNAASDPERGKGRLNNKVRVINADGSIEMKTIGVEVDIVHDFRENATKSKTAGLNTNLATFMLGAIPIAIPMPIPRVSVSEDQFRSVSTTKVINTFGLLKETIAHDVGAKVYTRNLAWDGTTGEVLVTETVDEYNDKYFTFNYPAHWFYKGMGQASANLGLVGGLAEITPNSGLYAMTSTQLSQSIAPYQASDFLVKGDELYLSDGTIVWVSGVSGNSIVLMDQSGAFMPGLNNMNFEVVRSGHRNLQSAGIMNVTLMRDPLKDLGGNYVSNLGTSFLATSNWADWKIINAGAVDYSQDWYVGCECGIDPLANGGIYNPYRLNEKGVWRTKSSRTYLTGRNVQGTVTPRREGYFTSFSPMYKLSNGGNWYKDFTDWTYVAEVTKYSPYGFELENVDALNRYSAAQYGYNNTFPMAVGANTQYSEIGYDGFEDYSLDGCAENAHFNFKNVMAPSSVTSEQSHTGRHSLVIGGNSRVTLEKKLGCPTEL
jgi:hypothetical protein